MRDKRVHTFPKGISQKVNVIVRVEFGLIYYDVTGACGIKVIIIENGHSNLSSNPGGGGS